MTREEAIGHIKDVICENNTIKPNIVVFEQEKEALYMAIKALKQEPKWIPASERLPEERDWYLAVFKEKDTGYQLIPRVSEYIGENKWRIIDEEAFVTNYIDILKCVAWMPLPEPYKTESEVIE